MTIEHAVPPLTGARRRQPGAPEVPLAEETEGYEVEVLEMLQALAKRHEVVGIDLVEVAVMRR